MSVEQFVQRFQENATPEEKQVIIAIYNDIVEVHKSELNIFTNNKYFAIYDKVIIGFSNDMQELQNRANGEIAEECGISKRKRKNIVVRELTDLERTAKETYLQTVIDTYQHYIDDLGD